MSSHGTARLCAWVLFLAGCLGREAVAREAIVFWSGEVESVVEFKAGAAPAGIEAGDSISGTLRFDQSAYDTSSSILGNVFFGNRFIYETALVQDVSIEQWTWSLDSGIVTLSQLFDTDYRYFDVFTDSSAGFGFIEFPSHVGSFELGFALRDDQPPLGIFDSFQLDVAVLDPNEATWGGGHISSRARNDDGDIVDGYYLTFEILQAPEPRASLVANAALLALGSLANRRRSLRQ